MTDRRLYTATLTAGMFAAQSGVASTTQALSKLTSLSGNGDVTNTGGSPDELPLQGQIKGPLADIASAELRELLSAPDFDALPLYAVDDTSPDDGYYTVESGTSGRVRPQAPGADEFQAQLVRKGTLASHRRVIATAPAQVVHQWGTATDAPVGVPATASKVLWLDADGTQQSSASPSSTVSAEYGDVDIYRADTAPYQDPKLVYQLPLADEGNVDAALFDTWGNSRTEGGAFAYQQVFRPDHRRQDVLELNNGLLRLTIDESTNPITFSVEEYASGAWSSLSLGTSNWRLADIDIRDISPLAIRARTRWTDTGGSDTHTLDLALHRGWDSVQFFEPTDSTGSIIQSQQAPQGLVDRLDPIASQTLTDPDPRRGLIARAQIPL